MDRPSKIPPLVCLVTPGHVASTPRLVKAADALVSAGYRVHVVAGAPFPPADRLDSEILAQAKWAHTRAAPRSGTRSDLRKAARLAARAAFRLGSLSSLDLAGRAQLAEGPNIAGVAARLSADLYIGHSAAGLYPAASAAQATGARFGFDLEDYHDAETEEALADPIERRIRSTIQSQLLRACRPLTCASPLIAREYKRKYGVDSVVVLNSFPLSQRPAAPVSPLPIGEDRPAILYWFSQTIGRGRGLEETIQIMGQMRTPVVLHLRGFKDAGYAERLQALAKSARLRHPIVFLDPGAPGEMARLASTADLGLSVETGVPLNHDLCLANKLFVYLLAGIPQLLSATSAHTAFLREISEASILSDIGQPQEAATKLDMFLADPDAQARARAAAWRLAQARFCWEIESEILVREVKSAVPITS